MTRTAAAASPQRRQSDHPDSPGRATLRPPFACHSARRQSTQVRVWSSNSSRRAGGSVP